MSQYHFISGLPRSGSTLLSAILNQNPNFSAAVTSPVLQLTRNVYEILNNNKEFESFFNEEISKNILKGIFNSYYMLNTKDVIFDTNRMWPNMIYLLKALYPDSKIILCVRDIPWVLDSFEKLRNQNPISIPNLYPSNMDLNVYSRSNYLMADSNLIGNAYQAIKSVMTGPFSDSIFFAEYDELCKNPNGMMKALYNFIEQPFFQHDFDNVETQFDEYDSHIRIKNMHKTRKKLEFIQRPSILPPDLWHQYSGLEVWKN